MIIAEGASPKSDTVLCLEQLSGLIFITTNYNILFYMYLSKIYNLNIYFQQDLFRVNSNDVVLK